MRQLVLQSLLTLNPVLDASGFVRRSRGRAVYLARLEAVSEWAPIVGAKLGCRDPDDDKLPETALMGAADCLVTGDWNLLEMSPFQNIPIPSPTGFLDLRTVR